MSRATPLYLVFLVLAVTQSAFGQVSDTGLGQFGTFQRNHIQTMNLFNLNNHIEIPLFAKKERGINFYAKLIWEQSDALALYQAPYPPGGSYFQVNFGPGFETVTNVNYQSHVVGSQTCSPFQYQAATTYFDSIIEQNMTVHPFTPSPGVQTGTGCSAGTFKTTTNDGQWLLTVTYTNQNCSGVQCITSVTETDMSGNVYIGTAALTDPNGNQITKSSSGSSTFTWADPTGNTVFTSNANSASPPLVYSYPTQTGIMANVQVNYTSGFTFQNNFGCNLPYVYPGGGSLATSISLPDGTSYSFVYESANGSYPSTTVTGRIHSITVPAGGTWTYTYSGGHNGINCSGTPGSPATISVTDSDGSVWTYNRTVCTSNCTTQPWSQTVVTDPACNDTVYEFDANGYQMQVQNYQGTAGTAACSASTQTLLQTVITCYNGDFTNCGTAPSTGTCTNPGGICRTDAYTYFPGLAEPSLSEIFYNANELPTQDNEFDFGVNTGSAPTTTPLRATKATYANIGNNILNRPSCVQITAGTSPSTCGTVTSTTKSLTNFLNYDSHGNVGTIQEWLSGTTYISRGLTYFSTGLVHTENDFKGTPTTYTYGDCNNSYPTQITTAGLSHYLTWDCNGGVETSTKDANGQTTSYSYTNPSSGVADPFWRLTQVTYPDTGQTTTTYNDTATPINVTTSQLIDHSGHSLTTQTDFDSFGRPSQALLTSDPDGTTYTATTYDALGRTNNVYNLTRCNPPTTNCGESTWGYTTYTYDALNRVTSVTNPDGSISTTTYLDPCTIVTDEAGNSREFCVDGLGRMFVIWEDPDNLGYETDYTYDALDNLTGVVQNFSRNRTFTYDGLSRLTSATNPESGTISYSYDANGNILQKTSPAPNQTGSATVTLSYCYDTLNRLTAKAYTAQSCPMSSPVATYLYDQSSYNGLTISNGIGRRTGMTDQAGSEAWSFDSVGRPLADQRFTSAILRGHPSFTRTTSYSYNLDGSIKTLTYASGRTFTYAYNSAARPISLSDQNGVSYASGAAYSPSGALASLTNASGLASRFYYNSRLQPCRISVRSGGAAPTSCADTAHIGNLLDYTYNFSLGTADNGNVTSITNNRDNTRSQNFTYDALNRLATAQTQTTGVTIPNSNCWGLTFGYDAWGNLLSGFTTGPAGCGEPMPLNVSSTTSNQLVGYCYDSAGNLLDQGSCPTTGPHAYVYNAENQMIGLSGATNTYRYDGDGKRVTKTQGAKFYWYGVGSDALDEMSDSFVYTGEYVFFGGKRIARIDSSGNTGYYFADHLGSSRVVTNSSGSILDDSDFYPFGGERPITSSSGNSYKFTGQERDSESGLDNFGARYYSSNMGRFMSPDPDNAGASPDNPQSWNAYAYVLGNPLNLTDPDGLGPCDNDPNQCIEVTALLPVIDPFFFRLSEQLSSVAQRTQTYLDVAWKFWINTKPNPGCVAASTASGAVGGAVILGKAGFDLGAAGGAIGGTLAEPGGGTALGFFGGGALGGGAGTIAGAGVGGGGGWLLGQVVCRTGGGGRGGRAGRTSTNQMNQQVQSGQAPRSVDRVDTPRFPHEQPHIEFKDGNALNIDGTWKHGGRALTNEEAQWISSNGWSLPR